MRVVVLLGTCEMPSKPSIWSQVLDFAACQLVDTRHPKLPV